ncbi:dTDP-4-dehydrorhamnose reductase [Rasiella sp. SM2506]|uniref:dTDP-4-dehydrorhamnose reductase n=1 Tax=Rasiella sp. SM2506 TaxID=3423914 RepID=UPI003D7B0C15
MKKILVTGANGQLGRCIQDIAPSLEGLSFVFATKQVFDISDKQLVSDYFSNKNFDYCINTAAYTNVEQAEKDAENAFKINAEGAKNLAEVCSANHTTLIHISTDYVFDGEKGKPYVETDATNPINVYGASKLKGEHYVQELCPQHYILRTSWLYSQYGHNFFNTIIKHAKAGNPLSVTTEQTGTPTNANDLAFLIVEIVRKNLNTYGLFHFSNAGKATWYDFAEEILTKHSQLTTTNLVKTEHYPTFASRPRNSVLDTGKVTKVFDIENKDWKESLQSVMSISETM